MINALSYPKILIISHNVIGGNGNMGSFLKGTFKGWPKDKLCQIYFHSEIPINDICEEFYRITDFDIIKSIFKIRKAGRAFSRKDIQFNRSNERVATKAQAKIYRMGKKNKSVMRIVRNLLWNINSWKTEELNQWMMKCKPEVIYFASGDYTFAYNIALYLSQTYKVPMTMAIYDDYYFNAPKRTLLEKLQIKQYEKIFIKTIREVKYCWYVSDVMKSIYEKSFNVNGGIQYKSAEIINIPEKNNAMPIFSYAGGLSLGRWVALVKIGKALKQIDSSGELYVNVYSSEKDKEIIKHMNKANGIKFHGEISSNEVKNVIVDSNVLIIVESMDNEVRKRTLCSLSTKVADCLASGRCIFAFGPHEVGTIKYLEQNNCACIVNDEKDLIPRLKEIMDSDTRKNYIEKALMVARTNHNSERIRENLYTIMNNVKDS